MRDSSDEVGENNIDIEFDNIKMYDEPHTPAELRCLFKNYALLSQRKFLYEKYMYSLWLQCKTMAELNDVNKILEIGPGHGVSGLLMTSMGLDYRTIDTQKDVRPDIIGDITTLDCEPYKSQFDLVCAFQVLEHFSYDYFKPVILKMASMSRKYIFISLPYHCWSIRFKLKFSGIPSSLLKMRLPKRVTRILNREWVIAINRPYRRAPNRKYRDTYLKEFPLAVHHWEIGRGAITVNSIKDELTNCRLRVIKNFHSTSHPYHYFILCEKRDIK